MYNLRRRHGFSLQFEGFTLMPDTDLDTMVQDELSAFPRTGETNVIGGLRQRGIYMQ